MFTNILLVCIPMIIFGSFMLAAFYMGFKFGKDEPIVGGDLDILEFAENEDEEEDADEEEG